MKGMSGIDSNDSNLFLPGCGMQPGFFWQQFCNRRIQLNTETVWQVNANA